MLRNYRAQLREVKEGAKESGDGSRAEAENVDPGGGARSGSSGNTRDGRPGRPCVLLMLGAERGGGSCALIS